MYANVYMCLLLPKFIPNLLKINKIHTYKNRLGPAPRGKTHAGYWSFNLEYARGGGELTAGRVVTGGNQIR